MAESISFQWVSAALVEVGKASGFRRVVRVWACPCRVGLPSISSRYFGGYFHPANELLRRCPRGESPNRNTAKDNDVRPHAAFHHARVRVWTRDPTVRSE